jgi:hypothetical protein
MLRWTRPFLLFAALAAAPAAAAGQGFALEGGGTYLDNRDEVVLSWGAGLYIPTGERTIASVHYVQWDEAEGDTDLEQCGADGCRGVGMHLLYRALGSASWGWFIGGGLDLYQNVVPVTLADDDERDYVGAVSLSSLLARGLSDRVSVYARGVLSAPAFESDIRTAYLHAGIVVRLF